MTDGPCLTRLFGFRVFRARIKNENRVTVLPRAAAPTADRIPFDSDSRNSTGRIHLSLSTRRRVALIFLFFYGAGTVVVSRIRGGAIRVNLNGTTPFRSVTDLQDDETMTIVYSVHMGVCVSLKSGFTERKKVIRGWYESYVGLNTRKEDFFFKINKSSRFVNTADRLSRYDDNNTPQRLSSSSSSSFERVYKKSAL